MIGGSIGGLVAGLLLRAAGWEVVICERSVQPLSGRGAGIVTHPQLWSVLDALGAGDLRHQGVQVEERVTLARDGRVVGRCRYPQTMTSWERLFDGLQLLWGGGDYRLGHDLCDLGEDAAGVTAHFADGRSVRGDLLIGADGVRSVVRRLVLGDLQPRYAGYVGWRGMAQEADIPAFAHRDLFHVFGFGLPPGEQMIGYPVAGDGCDLRPGHRRYNFVWYRPADEDLLQAMLTDAHGRAHGVSIPPPLIRPELVAAMRLAATERLAPQFAGVIAATPGPFLQPIYDLESPRLVRGRVALLGDAAFVVRPHVGAGVTKAAEDAMALAEALALGPDTETALARYEQARLPAGQRIVQRARHLGAYMQAKQETAEEVAAAARHHSVEAVMAETASLNF